VGLRDRLDDGKPEAEAFMLAGPARSDALEWLKQPGYLVLGHRRSGVRRDQPSAVHLRFGDQANAAALAVVMESIVDKVGHQALDELARADGAAGIFAGAAATASYAHAKDWGTIIPLEAWAGGLGAALLIGATAGLRPALQAARRSPTQALWSMCIRAWTHIGGLLPGCPQHAFPGRSHAGRSAKVPGPEPGQVRLPRRLFDSEAQDPGGMDPD
jgi:hypothetical protein